MATLKIQRLVSSSLLEVIVAMVIIVTVMSIAATIYVRIISSSTIQRKMQAGLLLDSIAQSTQEKKAYFDELIPIDTRFMVDKKIGYYEGNMRLLILSLRITDQENKVLATRKELTLINEDE